MKQRIRTSAYLALLALGGSAVAAADFSGRLFDSWRVYPVPSTARWAAFANMNGDNLPDLISLSGGVTGSQVTIRLNNSDGTFGASSSYPFGNDAIQMATADLDADGNVDVVVLNWSGGSVQSRLGDGAGGLGPITTYSEGEWLMALGLGDLDADGDADLLYSNYTGTARLYYRLNQGDGSFGPRGTIPLVDGARSIASDDLNQDGFDDLVVVTRTLARPQVLMNDGSGGFLTPLDLEPSGNDLIVEVADVDGDLAADIVVAGSTTKVHWNDGAGSFGDVTTITDVWTNSDIAIGDIDGDGGNDLVLSHYEDIAVVPRVGGRSFGAAQIHVTAAVGYGMALSDFDLDGDIDIAQSCGSAKGVYVRDNLGGGLFADNYQFPSLNGQQLRVADVDLDGDRDLISSAFGRAYVALYNGDGTFGAQSEYATPDFNAAWPDVGKLDDDAYPDIVLTNDDWHDYGFITLVNDGDGTYAPRQDWSITTCGPAASAIVDLDNDGWGDVAVANGGGGCPSFPERFRSVSISISRGDEGGFDPDFLVDVGGNGPTMVAHGDLDHDGDEDLVFPLNGGLQSGTQVSVLLNHGSGLSFDGPYLYNVGDAPYDLVLEDFNGDGYLDVATCNQGQIDERSPESVSVLLNAGDGTGTFLPSEPLEARTSGLGNNLLYITAGDVDLDGDVDLIVPGWWTQDIAIYLGRGDGSFEEMEVYGAGKYVQDVVFEDYNDDGIRDLVVGFGGGIGLVRGLATPTVSVDDEAPVDGTTRQLFSVRPSPNPSKRTVRFLYRRMESDARSGHISVYDSAGRPVHDFTIDLPRGAWGIVEWDGRTDGGTRVPAGSYFYRFEASGGQALGKIIIIR